MQVANVGRPDVHPRLARLMALPAPAPAAAAHPQIGTAYLSPSLAFNLGLALHLRPLLHGHDQQHTAQQAGDEQQQAGQQQSVLAAFDQVLVQRYSLPDGLGLESENGRQRQQWHHLSQPGDEAAAVPVAAEVQVAVVRTPQAAVLHQQRVEQGDTASGNQKGWQTNGSEAADGAGNGGAATSGTQAAAGAAASSSAASGDADDAVAALQQWFLAATRVVSRGDILAVQRVRGCSGGSASSSELLPNLLPTLHAPARRPEAAPPELLYFKIVDFTLSGSATAAFAAVDVASTAVKLVGSCSSALPVGLPHYLALAGVAETATVGGAAEGLVAAASAGACCSSSGSGGSGGYVPSPALGVHALAAAAPSPRLPGAGPMLPAWRQLAQLLASALHPGTAGLPLRLAVLLHGPAGCGKRTAAGAAAAAVGVHLVSLSCHDVRAGAGAAERHTFEGLRAAFEAAAGYAPAVLLLRHFPALGDGAGHGGSGGASAQSYASRLGSVLAGCIRAHCSGSAVGGSEERQPVPPATGGHVVLVACAASADDVPPPLRRCFTHELALEAPDHAQRLSLLTGSLGGVPAGPGWAPDALQGSVAPPAAEVSAAAVLSETAQRLGGDGLEETALHTAGLLPRELRAVAADAAAAAALQALPPEAVLAAAVEEQQGAAPLDGGHGRPHDGAACAALQPALAPEHLAAAVDAVRQRSAIDIGGCGVDLLRAVPHLRLRREPSQLCGTTSPSSAPCLLCLPHHACRRTQDPQRAVGGCGGAARRQAGHPGHRWEAAHGCSALSQQCSRPVTCRWLSEH